MTVPKQLLFKNKGKPGYLMFILFFYYRKGNIQLYIVGYRTLSSFSFFLLFSLGIYICNILRNSWKEIGKCYQVFCQIKPVYLKQYTTVNLYI